MKLTRIRFKMQHVPDDVWIEIYKHLDARTLRNVALVDKRSNRLTEMPYLKKIKNHINLDQIAKQLMIDMTAMQANGTHYKPSDVELYYMSTHSIQNINFTIILNLTSPEIVDEISMLRWKLRVEDDDDMIGETIEDIVPENTIEGILFDINDFVLTWESPVDVYEVVDDPEYYDDDDNEELPVLVLRLRDDSAGLSSFRPFVSTINSYMRVVNAPSSINQMMKDALQGCADYRLDGVVYKPTLCDHYFHHEFKKDKMTVRIVHKMGTDDVEILCSYPGALFTKPRTIQIRDFEEGITFDYDDSWYWIHDWNLNWHLESNLTGNSEDRPILVLSPLNNITLKNAIIKTYINECLRNFTTEWRFY